ncbi:MAG: MFS transporter, partial [Alphaproteobacteria bacterium]
MVDGARAEPVGRRARAGRFRWLVVTLLFAIAIVNYIDRSAISYAIVPIARELGLDDAARGLVLGAFGIGYAATTLIGGFLVDRYGPRRVLMAAVLFWALATGAAG